MNGILWHQGENDSFGGLSAVGGIYFLLKSLTI